MPASAQCVTSPVLADTTTETNCYYSCNTTDNCNSLKTNNLKTCTSNCSYSIGGGFCDYFTGKCQCNTGYSGVDCSAVMAITYRSCVQCNSETDSGCETRKSVKQCPGNDESLPYCSATKTSTIDSAGNIIRNIVTRGCTSSFTSADECFFSKPSDSSLSNYTEYTCISTCDTNGCNTGTPDGIVDATEDKALYCVQCTGPQGTGSCQSMTTPTRCPSSTSKYCVSTVEYYISETSDGMNTGPVQYELINEVRACSSESVAKGCSEPMNINTLSAKKVTCKETCTTNGCNIGWPARPRCSKCVSQSYSSSFSSPPDTYDGYDSCIFNPPSPVQCDFPYQQYCVAFHNTKQLDSTGKSGYTETMMRGCSYQNHGNGCTDVGTANGFGYSYYSCNRTCETYGCNRGLINASSRPIQSVIATLSPALVTFLLQRLLTSF
nr:uncharacterized protein LOC108949271 isoform X5 [Ciona intestinalis]XP_026691989.1 uncharacterized protein LOC108949271 isoform X5 [Ciona intestinalis]XP_026691990.1 uncharacterized protein LOC108949271 isoform X5 [Ciona intestinalis]XP_026691991.1 uncharacterized protein LOC108949271 isoform X5 [Ciona intestinalis]|eukprot:XP_026691988.1 uncharacterized protein LOC108949271 isoform X5 [Ciona intestinalis]